MGLYFTADGLRRILTNEAAAGPNPGLLAAVKVHLIVSVPALTPYLKWADLTEANYDGYAAQGPIIWGGPFSDSGGVNMLPGRTLFWADGGAVTPNVITGYALTLNDVPGPTVLLAVEMFPAGIPMAALGQGFALTPAIAMPCDLTALPGAGVQQ